MKTATTGKAALKDEAAKLFEVPVEDKRIQACLYALGFRQECGRCGGTGHYSYNQIHGTVCYGCGGKKFVAVKLTRKVLDDARIKVEAGELAHAREAAKAKLVAKKSIGGLVEAARAVYKTIADAFDVEYRKVYGAKAVAGEKFDESISLAQTMNNAIFWDHIHGIVRAVEFGRRKDYEQCVTEIVEATELLVILRNEWLRYGV